MACQGGVESYEYSFLITNFRDYRFSLIDVVNIMLRYPEHPDVIFGEKGNFEELEKTLTSSERIWFNDD